MVSERHLSFLKTKMFLSMILNDEESEIDEDQ